MTFDNTQKRERVILAGVCTGFGDALTDTSEKSIAELAELAATAGAEVVGSLIQNKAEIESATYMGTGKLAELREMVHKERADAVIFDDELTPIQLRNITDELDVKVLDRTMLILDIFALHAKSRTGKIEVELAQLRYSLPRLSGQGTGLSRLGGGIGTRGPGETKLETSRRHIRTRISHLKAELSEIEKNTDLIRRRRKKNNMPTVALAGYTNAGKSTLLNLLTDSDVLAENRLFATLDPTVRLLTLPDKREVLLSDTVGFINKLPHQLVEAFKSTLDEVVYADVILNVVDASDPDFSDHIEVVNRIFGELGVKNRKIICVFNKTDQLPNLDSIPKSAAGAAECIAVSAKTGFQIEELKLLIQKYSLGEKRRFELLLPFDAGRLNAELHENCTIEAEEFTENGTKLTLWLDEDMYRRCREFVI